MCDVRFVLCERCGSEGRLYSGHSNDPNPRDVGRCSDCDETGYAEVPVEPMTMEEALELDGEKLRQLTGQDHGPFEIEK